MAGLDCHRSLLSAPRDDLLTATAVTLDVFNFGNLVNKNWGKQ